MTPAAAARRFVLLAGLRWLPTGLVVPVMVLLAASRGLSPAQIAVVFTLQGAVVVALELPTGGLADALGRRALLVAGGLLHALGLGVMVVAQDLAPFCLAYVLVAVGRALDSGPLETWYVDTARALQPDIDVTPALARAGVAEGAALFLGAVVGGAVPVLADDRLWLPVVAAAALAVAHAVAVLVLLVPVGPSPPRRTATAALRQGLADVPATVSGTLQLTRRDGALRLLLALSAGIGFVLGSLELLVPLRLSALAGDQASGAAAFGAVIAATFAAGAIGNGSAPRVRTLARDANWIAMATLLVLSAAALAVLAAAPTVVLLAVPYVVFALLLGVVSPLRKKLLHDRVPAARRATMVSAVSLALQLGGISANNVQAWLYEQLSPRAPFVLTAAVLLLLAALTRRQHRHS